MFYGDDVETHSIDVVECILMTREGERRKFRLRERLVVVRVVYWTTGVRCKIFEPFIQRLTVFSSFDGTTNMDVDVACCCMIFTGHRIPMHTATRYGILVAVRRPVEL